jgi:hypothetical protein
VRIASQCSENSLEFLADFVAGSDHAAERKRTQREETLMHRFQNSRVRLVRLSGGPSFGGWFFGRRGDVLVVELSSDEALAAGEAVRLYATCADCQAEMDTVHVATEGRTAVFAMPDVIRMEHRTQQPRYRSHDSKVSLVTRQGVFPAEDVDISVGGFGFTSSAQLGVGEKAKVVYQSPDFDASFDVECRYCRAVEGGAFHFGFMLNSTDRMLNARWVKYLSSLQPDSKAA